jgi:hypothetical protein
VWIRIVDYLLAAAGLVGHLALLVILLRRHLLSRLPAFAILMFFYLLRSALLLVPQFTRDWPASYWLLIYLDPGLQLLVILAIGLAACRNSKSNISRLRVAVAIVLFIIVSAAAAWLIGYSSHYSPRTLSLKLSMFVSTLWLQVAVGLILLLRKTDWPAKRLTLGIALGFAAYSAANILAEVVHAHFALVREPALYAGLFYFRVIIYLCCLLGWSILILRDRSWVFPAFHTIDS